MFDQAANLRKKVMVREKEESTTKIVAIASGKGGVGKSNFAINTALAMQRNNKRVLLLDGDMGTANINVLLGLSSKYNLSHLLHGKCTLEDALINGPEGLDILPGTSGDQDLININKSQVKRLMSISSQMGENYDIILVDIGAGVHASNINFISFCKQVIVVLTPEPTAIMDAYSLIKILYNNKFSGEVGLLINQVNSRQEGNAVAERMQKVIKTYLEIDVKIIGIIPFDRHLRQAVKKQNALIELYPNSKSGRAFAEAASNIIKLENQAGSSGAVEGFMGRLLNLFK